MPRPHIILASASKIRKKILQDAGVEFSVQNSKVDEHSIKQKALALGKTPNEIAQLLALAKAQNINLKPDTCIIGADQLLEMDGKIYDKPKSIIEARERLKEMRGREHRLIGAVVVCEQGQSPWVFQSTTRLFMRKFSDVFLDMYLQNEGDDVLQSVGAYMFERRGAQLFRWVEGDFFSILGLPLLPLLAHLRARGATVS